MANHQPLPVNLNSKSRAARIVLAFTPFLIAFGVWPNCTSIAGLDIGASASRASLVPAPGQQTGPGVGWITSLSIDPVTTGVLYAGTLHAGLYKSTSGGQARFPINSGIDHNIRAYYVAGIAVDPTNGDVVYATVGELYKSIDAGAHWLPLDTSSVGNGLITAPVVDDGGIVYIGVNEGGVARSPDGGKSWAVINSGLPRIIYSSWLWTNPIAGLYTPICPRACSRPPTGALAGHTF